MRVLQSPLTDALWKFLSKKVHPSEISTSIGRSQERYRRAALSGIAAVTARLIAIGASLVTVPLTLRYLGMERYGMLMTITSMIAMFSFADLGMSNGLVNLIAESIGHNDKDATRRAIASAFWILGCIGLCVLVVVASVYTFLPWSRIFNVYSVDAVRESGPALLVLVACFAVSLPLGIIPSVQSGLQNGFISNLWTALGSVISLCAVLTAIHFHAGLPLLILGLSGAPILATLCNGAQLFLVDHPWMLPRVQFFSKKSAVLLLNTGLMFFCLQVATAIGYQSDNLVIAHILGAKQVAAYAIPSRLFNILPMLIGMIIGPMWPAYTDALARGDGHWIRKTFLRTAMGGAAITLVLSALLVVFGNVVLSFWVGPQIHASHALLFAFGIRCLLSSYLQPISFFLNGVGQLRVQAVIAIIMAIFNLALSIVLVQHFGIIGAILGTIVAEVIIVLIPETIIVRRVLRQLPRQ